MSVLSAARAAPAPTAPTAAAAAPAAIEVRDLVKRFGSLTAVDGLSFTVPLGSCLGFLGPNGAGKTTTLEILEGFQPPASGEVSILGLRWSDSADRLRAQIGISLQETRLTEKLTVDETVRLFRSFYSDRTTVEEALGAVELLACRKSMVGTLSGGQRQRLSLAIALVGKPKILFLDEPTTGLDPVARRDVWDVIAKLKAGGCTVVLTTHYLEEAERLSDSILIIDHGRLVAQGTPRELIATLGGEEIIEFSCSPGVDAARLQALPGVRTVTASAEGVTLTVAAIHQTLPALVQLLEKSGVLLRRLSTRQATLDDVFLSLTGRRLTGGEPG